MSGRKAQSSFEALLLLALIFMAILFIFSVFFQIRDSSLAMQLTKIAVMEKLSALQQTHWIERIDFTEASTLTGTEITLSVSISPKDHGLTTGSFPEEQDFIKSRTKYEKVTINPV